MKYLLSLLVFFSFFSVPAHARPKIKWTDVQIGAIRVTPKNWATDAFMDFAWTPLYDFDGFGLRLDFGVTGVRHNGNGNRFMITQYQAFAFAQVISIFGLEAGGGFQTWHSGYGGTNPIAGGSFLIRIGEDFFDRMYISILRNMSPTNPATIFRSGIAFNL